MTRVPIDVTDEVVETSIYAPSALRARLTCPGRPRPPRPRPHLRQRISPPSRCFSCAREPGMPDMPDSPATARRSSWRCCRPDPVDAGVSRSVVRGPSAADAHRHPASDECPLSPSLRPGGRRRRAELCRTSRACGAHRRAAPFARRAPRRPRRRSDAVRQPGSVCGDPRDHGGGSGIRPRRRRRSAGARRAGLSRGRGERRDHRVGSLPGR